jgi:hypothetical protein
MLKFLVYDNGQSPAPFVLRNAHLLGADGIGVRGTICLKSGAITCEKRSMGPVALSLQYPAGEVGELTLQTCLLPEREEPYLLTLELARHRLMLLLAKQEDWMMFDLNADHPAMRRAAVARAGFVKALNAVGQPEQADRLARESLVAAIDASEELALAHAERLFGRRRQAGQFHRGVFGCGVGAAQHSEKLRASLLANFDYLMLPTRWRRIEPAEQQFNWGELDNWAEWGYRNRMPILAGPIVSFRPDCSPDWLTVMAHDYETIRDVFYEHVERLVTRYRNVVTLWNVVSGIHTNAQLNLTIDQLMDLTRMAIMLVKKIQPNGKTLVEITHPFGEYYSVNMRSIPPFIFADMVLQAGIPIDAFGVRLVMGRAGNGLYTRDLMQVSALLDRFSALGKPVHVTGVAVPSGASGKIDDHDYAANGNGKGKGSPVSPPDDNCGHWRKPWSPLVQTHWLEAFYSVALSKPYIDSVAWLNLADHEDCELPHGGLAGPDFKAKGAFHRLIELRRNVHSSTSTARNATA